MTDYHEALKKGIKATHGCEAVYVESVPVTETFQGKIAWEGVVEVFVILDYPKAKHCYAWAYADRGQWEVTAVLEIPPATSPQLAVRVAIAAHANKFNGLK